jgi:hypothetical protein
VGRALARANGGDLVLEPAAPGSGGGVGSGAGGRSGAGVGAGAAFTLMLPAEAPTEG